MGDISEERFVDLSFIEKLLDLLSDDDLLSLSMTLNKMLQN